MSIGVHLLAGLCASLPPHLGHLLQLLLLILLLLPYTCQDGRPFVISNLQAQRTLHRSLFGVGGSVVGARGVGGG